MAYTLNKFNGDVLLVLNDGVADGPSFPIKSTSVNLIGKNISNFGDAQNENFVWLLENFARNTQPNNPLKGQIWFDTNTNVFRPAVYDGVNWRALAVLQYSNTTTDALINNGQTPFVANNPGDMWFDSVNKQLYVITSTASDKTLIGPEVVPGFDITRFVSTTMFDNVNVKRPVIQATLNGEVIGVLSNATFTSNSSGISLGFPKINRGLTFKNSDTTISSVAVSATTISSTNLATINATAVNINSSGISAVSITATTINSSIVNGNSFVGSSANIASMQSTNIVASLATVTSLTATTANFSQAYDSGSRVLTEATIGSHGVTSLTGTANQIAVSGSIGSVQISLPSSVYVNQLYDNNARVITTATLPPTIVIGDTPPAISAFGTPVQSGTLWWDSVYNNLRIYYNDGDSSQWVDAVSTIIGPAGPPGPTGAAGPVGGTTSQVLYNKNGATSGSSNLTFDDTSLTAAGIVTTSISTGAPSTSGSITGSWVLTAGSRFQSTYADIAEYYSSDKDYAPGTVLVFGGSAEVTTTDIINNVKLAGVVTTNPSYVMNQDQQGVRACIALQGRIPVKVLGTISKGDMLTTSEVPGCAVKAITPQLGAVIGKALEDKHTEDIGFIEVAVGRN